MGFFSFGRNKKSARKDESRENEKKALQIGLKRETKHSILAIVSFVLVVFLVLAAFGQAGVAGEKIYAFLASILGMGYFLLPLALLLAGFAFLKAVRATGVLALAIGFALFLFSGLGLLDLVDGAGGTLGNFTAEMLVGFFDTIASSIVLLALFGISIMVMFDSHFKMPELTFSLDAVLARLRLKKKEAEPIITGIEDYEMEALKEEPEGIAVPAISEDRGTEEEGKKPVQETLAIKTASEEREDEMFPPPIPLRRQKFTPPPLSLIEKDRGKPGVADVKASANSIKRTLQTFGIEVEMDEISIGPTVTRYALKPAAGVKLSRIVALKNDLSLALAAHPIRIEAPIPGKSLVGIEIPNTKKSTVGLASMLAAKEWTDSNMPLLFSVGKTITGNAHFSNLAKLPHALIAGATGSGKSVVIHAIITSLLYRNPPDILRFIMIDPKRVELSLYNKIPHLLTPVITDPKKAILTLKWAAREMERRYDILQTESVRDISSYHENIVAPSYENAGEDADAAASLPEFMPYIVIIIDELADIMATYPRELEAAIVRLAQMSRAVGIHLVLSTQRPSVNVITGLIKANVPARIAMQVASQIDSRTIIDMSGAEALLGAGDMLYLSSDMSKPLRLQSAYITEQEVKKVVRHIIDAYEDDFVSPELALTEAEGGNRTFEAMIEEEEANAEEDELYEEARELVMNSGKASTSYLQRKLGIGYARAARIIDMLEERGVVGPGDGSKRREVLEGGAPDQLEWSGEEMRES
ncbi:DNA translocase FtsK [bacterium]|nr:DNA translocase FtsK [bacterium]MCI0679858.1 DNA translocase FtsK [bacterium]